MPKKENSLEQASRSTDETTVNDYSDHDIPYLKFEIERISDENGKVIYEKTKSDQKTTQPSKNVNINVQPPLISFSELDVPTEDIMAAEQLAHANQIASLNEEINEQTNPRPNTSSIENNYSESIVANSFTDEQKLKLSSIFIKYPNSADNEIANLVETLKNAETQKNFIENFSKLSKQVNTKHKIRAGKFGTSLLNFFKNLICRIYKPAKEKLFPEIALVEDIDNFLKKNNCINQDGNPSKPIFDQSHSSDTLKNFLSSNHNASEETISQSSTIVSQSTPTTSDITTPSIKDETFARTGFFFRSHADLKNITIPRAIKLIKLLRSQSESYSQLIPEKITMEYLDSVLTRITTDPNKNISAKVNIINDCYTKLSKDIVNNLIAELKERENENLDHDQKNQLKA